MQNYSSDKKITVVNLKKWGCFIPGRHPVIPIEWYGGMANEQNLVGNTVAVQSDFENKIIKIGYVILNPIGRTEQVVYEIKLIEIKCNYGGCRYLLECPYCFRRVGVIYKPDESNRLGCRTCHKIRYATQLMSRASRKSQAYMQMYLADRIADLEDCVMKRPFYRGKLTKKHQRLDKLSSRAGYVGFVCKPKGV